MKLKGARTSVILRGRPTPVSISIPRELIKQAETYPAINWNQVMARAVKVLNNAEAKGSKKK